MSLLPSPSLRPVALLAAVALCTPSILATNDGRIDATALAVRFLAAFAVASIGIALVERLIAGYARENEHKRRAAEKAARAAEKAARREASVTQDVASA